MNTLPKGVQKQVQQLNKLSTGIGAIKLPEKVQRLELRMNKYVNATNIGAKSFWRQELPPIQFYNPNLPISVRRFDNPNQKRSELIVDFTDGTSKTLQTDNKQQQEILNELVELTGARAVPEEEVVRV